MTPTRNSGSRRWAGTARCCSRHCQGIAHDSDFMNMMQRILKMLESEYGRPVDIEFAMEEGGDGKIHLNLFQCRPLRQVAEQKFVMPEGHEEEVLFDVRRTSMWRSKEEKLDIIVWVDPQKYYEYPYAKKPDVAHMIGVINQYFSQQGRHMMLHVPGRCGTSSPELGVPVKYSGCELLFCHLRGGPTARPVTIRPCPTAATCFRSWWRRTSTTAPSMKIARRRFTVRII